MGAVKEYAVQVPIPSWDDVVAEALEHVADACAKRAPAAWAAGQTMEATLGHTTVRLSKSWRTAGVTLSAGAAEPVTRGQLDAVAKVEALTKRVAELEDLLTADTEIVPVRDGAGKAVRYIKRRIRA